jgi:2-keto-3-deoxy-6-phosphogluconate aldolase
MLDSGAIAVGLGSTLFPNAAIAVGDWDEIEAIARQLQRIVKD